MPALSLTPTLFLREEVGSVRELAFLCDQEEQGLQSLTGPEISAQLRSLPALPFLRTFSTVRRTPPANSDIIDGSGTAIATPVG